jgi:hypothetical protein
MNVEIGTDAAQVLFLEYINPNFFAVQATPCRMCVGLQVPVSAAGAAGRGGGGQVQPRQCVHRAGQAVPEPSSITGKPNLETPKPVIASKVSKYRKLHTYHRNVMCMVKAKLRVGRVSVP